MANIVLRVPGSHSHSLVLLTRAFRRNWNACRNAVREKQTTCAVHWQPEYCYTFWKVLHHTVKPLAPFAKEIYMMCICIFPFCLKPFLVSSLSSSWPPAINSAVKTEMQKSSSDHVSGLRPTCTRCQRVFGFAESRPAEHVHGSLAWCQCRVGLFFHGWVRYVPNSLTSSWAPAKTSPTRCLRLLNRLARQNQLCVQSRKTDGQLLQLLLCWHNSLFH